MLRFFILNNLFYMTNEVDLTLINKGYAKNYDSTPKNWRVEHICKKIYILHVEIRLNIMQSRGKSDRPRRR